MKTLLCSLVIAASCFGMAEATTFYFATNVPANWGGSEFTSHEILENTDGVYTSILALSPGTEVSALTLMSDGSWVYSPSHLVELEGVLYESRDIIVFDGTSYSLFLSGSVAGIPQRARIDAIFLTAANEVVLSFDIPVGLDSVEYSRSDLILYNGSGYSLYWDSESEGVPASANLIGAELDENLQLILSFDVPLELENVLYLPQELVLWSSGSFSSYYIDNSAPSQAGLNDFAFPNVLNTAPAANDDPSYITNEDITLNGGSVLTNDSDLENDPLTALLDSAPSHAAAFSLNSNGTFSYTPATNFNGIDTFTYHAHDGEADSSVATVTITVIAVNDDPLAQDDYATLEQDTSVDLSALDNDSDPDNDSIHVTSVNQPTNGTVQYDSDGKMKYTPNPGFFGLDTFSYTITDGVSFSSATVHLTVEQVTDPIFISVDDTMIAEPVSGIVTASLTVSLSQISTSDVMVDYQTQPGTADSDEDFVSGSGTLTIPAGQISGTLEFEVNADAVLFEGSESLYVILSNPANATIADSQGTISIVEQCLFCDDFEDGTPDPDWNYIKQSWIEQNGNLQGTPLGRKAVVIADPVFANGCDSCYVNATITSGGGTSNRIWLFGWYVDKKNTIELLIKEESDKVILKQRVNGKVVAKAKGLVQILPDISYDVRVAFDGNQFTVGVDGSQLVQLTPKGLVPAGTVGFQIKNTTGRFGHIIVN